MNATFSGGWIAFQIGRRHSDLASIFEHDRNYTLGDPELDLIGDRAKLAQWRHKGTGPAFYKLRRKIVYRGADLNAWAEAHRVDPSTERD